ncbi:hypothetical protein QJS04_geneDACA020098 [Acorus gramineus]|uniref:Uncharacterized protein n=1 Tax=Acorus gramineus TaxID=55184 RepID=A0AAV9A0L5_ACOGR|nr:hypothetical protein QJS04_geneDACA020098 [Acorus gramineus]
MSFPVQAQGAQQEGYKARTLPWSPVPVSDVSDTTQTRVGHGSSRVYLHFVLDTARTRLGHSRTLPSQFQLKRRSCTICPLCIQKKIILKGLPDTRSSTSTKDGPPERQHKNEIQEKVDVSLVEDRIPMLVSQQPPSMPVSQQPPTCKEIAIKISDPKEIYMAIDAIDNGINQFDTDKPPKYVNNTTLSSRVGRLNLDWMDPDQSQEKENEAFQRAMVLAGSEFLENVCFHARSWLPARSIVMECLTAREKIDPSGEIMVLDRFCPWKLHLFELEEEMKIDPPIKYVLYQDDRSKHWRVQAVAVSPDKFESRRPLPLRWRGLRDEDLSKVSGIPGCVFVHMSGFIGGNQSYDGALAMARAALKL